MAIKKRRFTRSRSNYQFAGGRRVQRDTDPAKLAEMLKGFMDAGKGTSGAGSTLDAYLTGEADKPGTTGASFYYDLGGEFFNFMKKNAQKSTVFDADDVAEWLGQTVTDKFLDTAEATVQAVTGIDLEDVFSGYGS